MVGNAFIKFVITYLIKVIISSVTKAAASFVNITLVQCTENIVIKWNE